MYILRNLEIGALIDEIISRFRHCLYGANNSAIFNKLTPARR